MSLSIQFGNFLYKHFFVLYRPLYKAFKNRQDAFEIRLLRENVSKGDVVLDIGANIGFYATLLAEMVTDTGKVHCFEPDQTNYAHLKAATEKLSNVIIHNKAVGPKTEKIKIYTSKDLNVDHRTYQPEEYEAEMDVEALALDDYIGKDQKVNFIKMDIQGFEMQAVRGMKALLRNNQDVKIISEFWPYGLNKAGSSLSEYYQYLRSDGFEIFLLEKNRLVTLLPDKVKSMESLGKEHYFNIFAKRPNV